MRTVRRYLPRLIAYGIVHPMITLMRLDNLAMSTLTPNSTRHLRTGTPSDAQQRLADSTARYAMFEDVEVIQRAGHRCRRVPPAMDCPSFPRSFDGFGP